MRKVVAALAVSTMLVACAHRDEYLFGGITAGIGGVSMGVGGLMALSAAIGPSSEDPSLDGDRVGGARDAKIAFFGGLAVAVIGLIFIVDGQRGLLAQESDKEKALRQEGAVAYAKADERVRINRGNAWAATQRAAAAARAGNCGSVHVEALYVYNLDPDFYGITFARDPAIIRCLPPPAPTRDPTRDREQAFALVKTAKIAARAGNCALVLEIDRSIRHVDPEVYAAWFVRDDAIKTCLAAPAP